MPDYSRDVPDKQDSDEDRENSGEDKQNPGAREKQSPGDDGEEADSVLGETGNRMAPDWEHVDPLLVAAFTEADQQHESLHSPSGADMDVITKCVIVSSMSLSNHNKFCYPPVM